MLYAQLGENTYQIDLLYEETPEESYYGYMPEVHNTATFVITGDGTMQIKFDDGPYISLLYGGQTFEEASQTVIKTNG